MFVFISLSSRGYQSGRTDWAEGGLDQEVQDTRFGSAFFNFNNSTTASDHPFSQASFIGGALFGHRQGRK